MKEIHDASVLVVDSGLFIPFARRLAEDFARVVFYNPDRSSFPTLKQGAVGAGFEDIEHTLDFWPLIDEMDMVAFPDIGNAGLQAQIRGQGFPVWGSGDGDGIEINRERFLDPLPGRWVGCTEAPGFREPVAPVGPPPERRRPVHQGEPLARRS